MKDKRIPLYCVLVFFVAIILAGCKNLAVAPSINEPAKKMTGAELVEARCDKCHSLDRTQRVRSDDEWLEHAQRMLSKSPDMLTTEEFELLITHLCDKY